MHYAVIDALKFIRIFVLLAVNSDEQFLISFDQLVQYWKGYLWELGIIDDFNGQHTNALDGAVVENLPQMYCAQPV